MGKCMKIRFYRNRPEEHNTKNIKYLYLNTKTAKKNRVARRNYHGKKGISY
jgi:hypothetical protein